jgi:hypothetical protein
MQGNNKIVLNQATMREAMQLWLDAQFKNPPRVVKIAELSSDGSVFELHVESDDAPPRS